MAWQSNINGGGVTKFRWNTGKTTGGFTGAMVDFNVDGTNVFYGSIGVGVSPDTKLHVAGAVTQEPLSSDPSDPSAGNSVQWVSDGTGS